MLFIGYLIIFILKNTKTLNFWHESHHLSLYSEFQFSTNRSILNSNLSRYQQSRILMKAAIWVWWKLIFTYILKSWGGRHKAGTAKERHIFPFSWDHIKSQYGPLLRSSLNQTFIQKIISPYIVTLAIRAFWQDISHSQDTVMWDIHLSNRTSQMTQSKHIATVYICSYHNSWRDVWTHANAIHFHV